MDEKKEEQKNDIILVVKKAIGDKVEIDDIIDSKDVDIIAKKVADRLYMDGWRKENPQYENINKEKQIEEIRKVVSFNCNKEGIAKHCPERIANGIYEASYRKADDVIDRLMNAKTTSGLTEKEIEFFAKHNEKVRKETVREFVQKLKEADERCQKKYGEGIGFTEINKIAEEYGVKID